jgi:hypothetical protein
VRIIAILFDDGAMPPVLVATRPSPTVAMATPVLGLPRQGKGQPQGRRIYSIVRRPRQEDRRAEKQSAVVKAR